MKPAPVPSKAIAPLRVQAPALPVSRADVSRDFPAFPSKAMKPCPNCGTKLRADLSDQEFLDHLGTCAPGIAMPAKPELPQIASGDHRGRVLGQRWYECEECGGQYEYLRRGGTCRGCEAKISG